MARLTSRRVNGIKEGYWSSAKKDELIQRLGKYEDIGYEPETLDNLRRWRTRNAKKKNPDPLARIRAAGRDPAQTHNYILSRERRFFKWTTNRLTRSKRL